VATSRLVKTGFETVAAALGLAGALLAAPSLSFAQSAPNSDQLLAQIATLEKSPAQAKLLKQPLDAAKSALNRARDARAAGDVEHGIQLEALASDYVTLARDTLRANDLETALRKTQDEYTKVETARRQTETLLEATVAQRERTKAQLLQAQEERARKKTAAEAKPEPKKANKAVKR
jgi:hypothetical protein